MQFRKYESIPNIYKLRIGDLNRGDLIHVSEKLDGANASFSKDEEGIHYFSRNTELLDRETLRGYTVWCDKNIDKDKIREGYIYYGEWNIKHKIKYNEKVENTFRLFDVYDIENDTYLRHYHVDLLAKELGIETVDTLYAGEYESLEHLQEFVGLSQYTEKGEGIVIRNYTNMTICKWVREDFREEKSVKQPKIIAGGVIDLCDRLCTDARIEKILHKGLDEGVYTSFNTDEFSNIMRYMSNAVVEDIIKENKEEIDENVVDEFVNYVKKRVPSKVKQIISNNDK